MPTRPKVLAVIAAVAAIVFAAATPATASILISAAEVGPDVVITVSGSFDTSTVGTGINTSWTLGAEVTSSGFSGGTAAQAFVPGIFGSPGLGALSVVSGSGTFSSGTISTPSTTGLPFWFFTESGGGLVLPASYVSGSALNTSATFLDTSIADFGWTSSTNNVWKFANSVSTITLTAVPEPATMAMLASGGVALAGALIRRRRLATKA